VVAIAVIIVATQGQGRSGVGLQQSRSCVADGWGRIGLENRGSSVADGWGGMGVADGWSCVGFDHRSWSICDGRRSVRLDNGLGMGNNLGKIKKGLILAYLRGNTGDSFIKLFK